MSVSNLTGTTWTFNSTIDFIGAVTYAVNITYDEYTFTDINGRVTPIDEFSLFDVRFNDYVIAEDTTTVDMATNSETFTITGGADVTNANLISWLEANATQQSTGYTITIDGTGHSVASGDTLRVNATGLYNQTTSTQVFTYTPVTGRFYGFNTSAGQTTPSSAYEIGDTFTASSNLTLYSVEQQPTALYDLDQLGLSAGTYTITAKAEGDGYRDSAASNPVQFTVQQSGYTVTITKYTSSIGWNIYDGQVAEGTPIGHISYDGEYVPITVTSTTGYITLAMTGYGDYMDFSAGDLVNAEYLENESSYDNEIFRITGNNASFHFSYYLD